MKTLRSIDFLLCLSTLATAQEWPHRRSVVAQIPTWTHLTLLDGHILVKDVDDLYLWSTQ